MPNEQHPSWALISLSHVSSSGTRLFRSPVEHHAVVRLSISTASMSDDADFGPRHHPERQLVEVYLSPVQFAELLTTPNRGQGVPCTITKLNAARVPEPPPEQDDIDEIADRAAGRGVFESVQLLSHIIAKVDALRAQGKGLSKTGLGELQADLETARMHATIDVDWWRKELSSRARAVKVKVTADLHATADLVIRNMGLGALAEHARKLLPTIPPVDKEA